jgi:hypothetical protein
VRSSDALVALAVLLGAALPSAQAAAQATPPQRCVAAADAGVFAGGWSLYHVQVVTMTTRLDCPLTSELSGGLDWSVVLHTVSGFGPTTSFAPGNPFPHLAWSRAFGALRPSARLGVVPPNFGAYDELAMSGRKRALATSGYLEPWLYVPATAWLVAQGRLVLDGAFLLEVDGALAGYIPSYRPDGLTAQLALALGGRIARRVELGARLGLYADLVEKLLPARTGLELSAMPFARLRVDGARFEVGLLLNLGPALQVAFDEKAFWSVRLSAAIDL